MACDEDTFKVAGMAARGEGLRYIGVDVQNGTGFGDSSC